MLKNLSQLECQINGKLHRYLCETDSTLQDVKEALFQFQKFVGQIEDSIRAEQARKESEEAQDISQEQSTEVA
jgi:hypothetical protein